MGQCRLNQLGKKNFLGLNTLAFCSNDGDEEKSLATLTPVCKLEKEKKRIIIWLLKQKTKHILVVQISSSV